MRGRIIAGAAAAAVASVALVADRRVRMSRAPVATLENFTAPEPDRAGFVRAADGARLYYEEDGPLDARVTVVLTHGFCLNHDDLLFQRRAILQQFGRRVRIVNWDLRSHGRSSHTDPEHSTIDQLGADLATIIDKRASSGSLVLIGHSMGGMTLMALAAAHPELFWSRVAGVGLVSTSTGKLSWITFGIPAGLARAVDPALRLALRGVRRQTNLIERGRARVTDASWVFVRRLAFGPAVDPALVEFLTQMIGSTPVDVIAEFYPTLSAHDKRAALDVLVDLPVAVVCGEDDLVTPPEHSQAIADLLPKASLTLVPATGHQTQMERPDLVNPPLLRLIQDALE